MYGTKIDSVEEGLKECARIKRELRRIRLRADPLLQVTLRSLERVVGLLETRLTGAKSERNQAGRIQRVRAYGR